MRHIGIVLLCLCGTTDVLADGWGDLLKDAGQELLREQVRGARAELAAGAVDGLEQWIAPADPPPANAVTRPGPSRGLLGPYLQLRVEGAHTPQDIDGKLRITRHGLRGTWIDLRNDLRLRSAQAQRLGVELRPFAEPAHEDRDVSKGLYLRWETMTSRALGRALLRRDLVFHGTRLGSGQALRTELALEEHAVSAGQAVQRRGGEEYALGLGLRLLHEHISLKPPGVTSLGEEYRFATWFVEARGMQPITDHLSWVAWASLGHIDSPDTLRWRAVDLGLGTGLRLRLWSHLELGVDGKLRQYEFRSSHPIPATRAETYIWRAWELAFVVALRF